MFLNSLVQQTISFLYQPIGFKVLNFNTLKTIGYFIIKLLRRYCMFYFIQRSFCGQRFGRNEALDPNAD